MRSTKYGAIEVKETLAIGGCAEIAFDPLPARRTHGCKLAVGRRGEAIERGRERVHIAAREQRTSFAFAYQFRDACNS